MEIGREIVRMIEKGIEIGRDKQRKKFAEKDI